jgi:hypothetical protein
VHRTCVECRKRRGWTVRATFHHTATCRDWTVTNTACLAPSAVWRILHDETTLIRSAAAQEFLTSQRINDRSCRANSGQNARVTDNGGRALGLRGWTSDPRPSSPLLSAAVPESTHEGGTNLLPLSPSPSLPVDGHAVHVGSNPGFISTCSYSLIWSCYHSRAEVAHI